MKAIFTTPWTRQSSPGYVPAPVDPYQVAVLTTTLQALLTKTSVLVHTLDQSHVVVVELAEPNGATVDVPEDTHREIQMLVDVLVRSHELCVYVPVEGIGLPPIEYQARMLLYVDAGDGTAVHMLPGTSQPALFADLRGSVDFSAESESIHSGILQVMTRAYVQEQGQGGVGATPVVLRADQDVAEALAVLTMYLWAYPDTVVGTYRADTQSVVWAWAGTGEPYSGPARPGVSPAAPAPLSTLPDGYIPLGVDPGVGDAVQRALGETLDLRRWRDVTLVTGPQATVCVLLARSLNSSDTL